jgi:hypothetical protein
MNQPATVIPVGAPVAIHETAATAAAALAKSQTEARYMVALARPRDMDAVRTNILKECKRPTFADVARYSVQRGKKTDQDGNWVDNYVEGPSIRFAEAAMRCMGNLFTAETTTYDDDEKRVIEISVTDLEANITQGTSVTVAKVIERKKPRDGDVVISRRKNSANEEVCLVRATEDEMLNRKNSLASKALRGLLLRCLPGDIVDEAMEVALAVQIDRDAKDPDAAKRKVLDAFVSINVPVSELKKYAGHDLSAVSPKELADLRSLHSAIKEGETTWRTAMEEKYPTASLQEKMKGDLGGKKEDPAATVPTDKKTPTKGAVEVRKIVTAEALIAAFKVAKDATSEEQAKAAIASYVPQGMPGIPGNVMAENCPAALQALRDLAGI